VSYILQAGDGGKPPPPPEMSDEELNAKTEISGKYSFTVQLLYTG